jgi:hypothetical protein
MYAMLDTPCPNTGRKIKQSSRQLDYLGFGNRVDVLDEDAMPKGVFPSMALREPLAD